MHWILAVVVLVVFLASLLADYKWRRWMAARRAERENEQRGGGDFPRP